jgi:hypothetical protein
MIFESLIILGLSLQIRLAISFESAYDKLIIGLGVLASHANSLRRIHWG